MKVSTEHILKQIRLGESLTVEFKKSQNNISRDVYV
jgi:hypothetical protein